MSTSRLDLGWVDSVAVESFGEPGQRTFRMLITTAEGELSVWLEKYQIALLAPALEELLAKTPVTEGEPVHDVGRLRGELEVRAGALALGYDTENRAFQIEVSDLLEPPMSLESIDFLLGRAALESMLEDTREILAASRPRCPLCGTPLDGEPHFCPDSNGHSKTAQIDAD